MNTQAYPSRFTAWWVVGLLFVAAIISYSDRQVMSLIVDPIRRDLGISDVGMSLLMGTAFAAVYALAGIPLGYLADRTSRRNLIAAAMLFWSLATICCGFARTFEQMFAARLAVGLGEAVLAPAAVSLIGDLFPPERRGTALGVYFTGVPIGFGGAIMIGAALLSAIDAGMMSGSALAHQPSWRSVLILIGAPGLLWGLFMLTFREPPRHAARTSTLPEVEAVPEGESVASVAKASGGNDFKLAPLFVTVAMVSLVDNAIAAWSPSLLIRDFHRDAVQIGVTLGMLFMSGGALGMLSGGFLSDKAWRRWGRSGRGYLCLAAACLGTPIVTLIDSSRITLTLIAIFVVKFASAVITSSGLAAILDGVPNYRRGLVTSISFFVNVAVGLGLGPTAVALTARFFVAAHGGLGPPLVVVAMVGYVIAAGGAWAAVELVRRSRERPPTRCAA
jgi:MFS family permease